MIAYHKKVIVGTYLKRILMENRQFGQLAEFLLGIFGTFQGSIKPQSSIDGVKGIMLQAYRSSIDLGIDTLDFFLALDFVEGIFLRLYMPSIHK
ncbi:hypothetical protein HMPREF1551_00800 [Capnocytophaga sp. oral taxon 863 str. F0517]|nr:hypothetical protein HMPREF1551_00800 [Capnocytophaga sp. oral taxon 863 str. F0517]